PRVPGGTGPPPRRSRTASGSTPRRAPTAHRSASPPSPTAGSPPPGSPRPRRAAPRPAQPAHASTPTQGRHRSLAAWTRRPCHTIPAVNATNQARRVAAGLLQPPARHGHTTDENPAPPPDHRILTSDEGQSRLCCLGQALEDVEVPRLDLGQRGIVLDRMKDLPVDV